MWANRYGLVSSDEGSACAAFSIEKKMPPNHRRRRKLDRYYGLDATWRDDSSSKLIVKDVYAGFAYKKLYLTSG